MSMIFRAFAATGLVLLASGAIAAPAKPKPASELVITNARAVAATAVAIDAGDKTVKLSKPLAPKAKATLKLPKMTGCTVAVAASFADETVAELDDFDVCKEQTVHFTD
jgi:hypothetical protein